MRYYSKSQMQAMEHQAVERGISMEDLMEYAGGAAAQFIQRKYTLEEKRVTILCGKGNNGGDGYVENRRLCYSRIGRGNAGNGSCPPGF